MKIVDRKKELIINAAGKNMSPANIEQQLKQGSPLIGQAVAIGDGRPYNVALLVLDPDASAAFAARARARGRVAGAMAGRGGRARGGRGRRRARQRTSRGSSRSSGSSAAVRLGARPATS